MSSPTSDPSIITADQIEHEIAILNNLKSRLTGTTAHDALIRHIEEQLTEAGLEAHSDEFRFTRWGPTDEASMTARPALRVDGESLPLASVFPYSGTTGVDGVTGEMVRLRGPVPAWKKARGKIAVIELNNFATPVSSLVDTWDGGKPWPSTRNPLIPATLRGLRLSAARKAGVTAVIFAWKNISDELATGQYIPFTLTYQDLPAAFVSGHAAAAALRGAAASAEATLTLPYELTHDASTRTVWSVVEGTSAPDETVFVVTHTDGVNAVEENGHIAAVAMARAAATDRPERTTVFVFTSGHMRIPAVTSKGQATSRFLADHPELWAGGAGQRRAVAGLAIEHLGAREFVDDPAANTFRPSGRIEPEMLYATTAELARLVHDEWEGQDGRIERVSKPTLVHFGEGEPLLHERIPAISLVTGPLYLLAERAGDERELIDAAALHRQVDNFERLYRRLSADLNVAVGVVPETTKAAKVRGVARLLGRLVHGLTTNVGRARG